MNRQTDELMRAFVRSRQKATPDEVAEEEAAAAHEAARKRSQAEILRACKARGSWFPRDEY